MRYYLIFISKPETFSSQHYECFAKSPVKAMKKCVQNWSINPNHITGITKLF